MSRRKAIVLALLLLNSIVLLGQLWPEGAPPFARAVNILTLALDVGGLALILSGRLKP